MEVLQRPYNQGKTFSAFYAMVNINNINTIIEKHYQECKKLHGKNTKEEKDVDPDYIVINKKKLDKKYLASYYKLLWVKYLDESEELVEYLKKHRDLTGIFKSKRTEDLQSSVIKQYINNGRESIMREVTIKEFISITGWSKWKSCF